MDNSYVYVPGLSEEVAEDNAPRIVTNTGAVMKITQTKKGDKIIKRREDDRKNIHIPICNKYALTIKEAAPYYNISEAKLKDFLQSEAGKQYALKVANRILIKRVLFERYLDNAELI